MNNFDFFKSVDKELHNIIFDAEKLYRDEYFEQCIGQTRRFAENVCKNVLGNSRTTEKTFDDMLATLKDKTNNSEQEKEFIDDLYFLKREGNKAVHSVQIENTGMTALECLQRAFEIAINYSVYYKNKSSDLLKLKFDTELLITGKKSKKTLAEKYAEEKALNNKNNKISKSKTKKEIEKQSYTLKTKKKFKKRFTIFKWLLILSSILSAMLIFAILILSIV